MPPVAAANKTHLSLPHMGKSSLLLADLYADVQFSVDSLGWRSYRRTARSAQPRDSRERPLTDEAGSLYTMFKVVTLGTPSTYIYSLSYAGAMLSWGIVIYKAFGIPQVCLPLSECAGLMRLSAEHGLPSKVH